MRDHALTEALKRLAAEAATRFSALVASGEQIPFDVAEQEGPDSLFHSYVPLTAQFVSERADEIRSLPAFAAACDVVNDTGIAVPYLEARGEAVPPEPAERAARVLTSFIAALWDGSSDFSLDRDRLDNAIAVLCAEARDPHEADVLIAPLVGLRMPAGRLQLPHGVRVVRADTIDAPLEAMRSEGMGRAAWEPQFLAIADQSGGPEGPADAMRQLHELISVMRLFKGGGIALGPYAFAPTGEKQWRRIATGAPATRPGGYQLNEAEAAELAELAAQLEARPDPDDSLAWGVARFEMGCERDTALAGLSDHLLALRATLEGYGPVGASLPMRAAALIADDSLDRIQARERVENALELERSLMNGARPDPAKAIALASWVEEGVRGMLREAALGELGTDISTAADETLIANGLDAGDAEIAVSIPSACEPDAGPEDSSPSLADYGIDPEKLRLSKTDHGPVAPLPSEPAGLVEAAGEGTDPAPREALQNPAYDELSEEDYMDQDTRIMEPIPAEDEIKITATNWLDEVSGDHRTLEWPAIGVDIERRERVDSPRVRHLFPVPEDADWEVRELDYDHYRGGHRRAG